MVGKNWEWSYQQGRYKRLKAETEARTNNTPFDSNIMPLHSYDGTMQSKFKQGWHSVTEAEIFAKLNGNTPFHQVRSRLQRKLEAQHGHS